MVVGKCRVSTFWGGIFGNLGNSGRLVLGRTSVMRRQQGFLGNEGSMQDHIFLGGEREREREGTFGMASFRYLTGKKDWDVIYPRDYPR